MNYEGFSKMASKYNHLSFCHKISSLQNSQGGLLDFNKKLLVKYRYREWITNHSQFHIYLISCTNPSDKLIIPTSPPILFPKKYDLCTSKCETI